MRHKLKSWRVFRFPLFLAATWGAYFTFLFARSLVHSDRGLAVANANAWGDWPLHISMMTTFAEKAPSEWFAYHPSFADGAFTYPFLVNLVSGMLLRTGLSLPASLILPSILLSLLMLWGMFSLLTFLLRSKRKALIALSCFFLSAGLGFVAYFKDFPAFPHRDYGRMGEYQWFASNFIDGMLLPQRPFLLGMTLSLWALTGLFSVLLGKIPSESERRKVLLASGIAVGLLPIAHMHSLMALVILLFPVMLFSLRRWRELVYFVIPAGVLASALYLAFVWGKIPNPKFMSWRPFYTAKGFLDWLRLWFWASGVLLPCAAAGFFFIRGRGGREIRLLFSGFLLLFVSLNLIQFQPQAWDNSKLFLWFYLGGSALAAHSLFHLWRVSRRGKAAAVSLFLLLTGTGWLSVLRLAAAPRGAHVILDKESLELADQIRAGTGPRDRFLTSQAHNHLVSTRAVRPVLVGYPGWVLNFGFPYTPYLVDIQKIYSGSPEAEELLKKHRIRYVCWGPSERHQFKTEPKHLLSGYEVAFRSSSTLILDVTRPVTARELTGAEATRK